MGLFTKKKKVTKTTVRDSKTRHLYTLKMMDNHIEINTAPLAIESAKKILRYDQVTDVAYESSFEKVAVSKSPIGRAVAGGLIFGGAGAIVGAISGTTTKTKNEINFHLIIAYTSKDGEDKFLQYEDSSVLGAGKFVKALKERCGIGLTEQSSEL